MATFNFRELTIRAHFDYVGPLFPAWVEENILPYVLPDLKDIIEGLKNGKKYFTQLKLSYKGQEFLLPNEPLISLSLTKTIVKTPTVGKKRRGKVKEYINTEDYQILIRGVCFDNDDVNNYPSNEVETINNLFEINDAVEVVDNRFLELFGIRKLVFESKEIEEMPGEQGLQKYTLRAEEDQDFFADLIDRDLQRTNFLTA